MPKTPKPATGAVPTGAGGSLPAPARRRRQGEAEAAQASRVHGAEIADVIVGIVADLSDHYDMPQIGSAAAHELWSRLLGFIHASLSAGRPVILRNVATLEPYHRGPQRYRHPDTRSMRVSKPTRHVRLILSPNLRESLRRNA